MPRVAISKHLKKVRKALAPKSINTNAGVAISQPVLTHMGFNPDILSDAKLMPLHVAAKRQSVTQRGFKVTIQQEEAKSPLVTSNKIKPAAALEELETCEESFVEISLQRSGSSTPSSLETRVNDSASGLPFNVGNSSKHSLSPFLDMSWEHPSTSSSRSSWALLPTSDAIQDQETCEKDFSAWDEFAICQDLSKN